MRSMRLPVNGAIELFWFGATDLLNVIPQNTPQLHLFDDLVATMVAFWYYVIRRKSNVFELFKTRSDNFPKAEVTGSNPVGGTEALPMFFLVGR